MTAALERPVPSAVFTQWTLQPLAVLAVIVLAAGYVYGVRRLNRPWPLNRALIFGLGLVMLIWTTCGMPGVYAPSLFWVWTTQQLGLWLVVPIVLLFGHPIQLARAVAGPGGRPDRILASRPVRIVSNPFLSPAFVPILSFGIFFGPMPGWAIGTPIVGWVLQLVLLVFGAGMALWLVGLDDDKTTTLAAGMALGIGMFELVADAIPGIAMRLNNNLLSTFFDHRISYSWSRDALSDQRTGGAVLWFIAELLDLPFLVLAYRRWRRIDAKDAERIDTVLEAERTARGAETDEPWWLSDPAMQARVQAQLKRRD